MNATQDDLEHLDRMLDAAAWWESRARENEVNAEESADPFFVERVHFARFCSVKFALCAQRIADRVGWAP